MNEILWIALTFLVLFFLIPILIFSWVKIGTYAVYEAQLRFHKQHPDTKIDHDTIISTVKKNGAI